MPSTVVEWNGCWYFGTGHSSKVVIARVERLK